MAELIGGCRLPITWQATIINPAGTSATPWQYLPECGLGKMLNIKVKNGHEEKYRSAKAFSVQYRSRLFRMSY
jgi:hypothetical protein